MSTKLYDLVISRRSIRRYEERIVPKSLLDKVLEAGRVAPSAKNIQPWHFIVITKEEVRKQFSKWRYSSFFTESPVIIVGCADHSNKKVSKWSTIDVTIALQNMVIAAHALGLGTCWIGCFEEPEASQTLGVPNNYKIVAMLSLGYPTSISQGPRKKTLDEIVSYEKWDKNANMQLDTGQ
jgi:nitroreductase